jgi:hypothetical protein
VQRRRFVLQQRADDFDRPLAGGEYDAAWQIERRVFGVTAGSWF